MSPKLKQLLLPQLVEERRKRESMLSEASEMDLSSASFHTETSSSTSDIPSPVTPNYSSRGHFRYPSSNSSVESPFLGSTVDSPSSPTFSGTKASKRSLPDVQEEPQEKEGDFDMFDDSEDHDRIYDCLCDDQECLHRDPTMAQSSVQLSTRPDFDYDLIDGFFSDGEFAQGLRFKKRRAAESPLTGLVTRFGTRFPSFSRKWKLRKDVNPAAASSVRRESAGSQAASRSSRSSSLSNSGRVLESSFEASQYPPTPTKSVFDDQDMSAIDTIDIDRANSMTDKEVEAFATTPLLPPLMMDASANTKHVPMQSPLQSPSVADCIDPFSGNVTPIDAMTTPQMPGMPSPPLSTKPSISSFHRNTLNRPGHLVPSSEIPPIVIADPNDEWSNKLGHANFTIYPEPYLPETFDLEACRQLRAAWDTAFSNYTKHLVRTGEHYGVTSKIYKLTEEKWASLDSMWRFNNDLTIKNTCENGGDVFATLKNNTLGDASTSNVMTKIPSLNDPRSGGKFPQLGDEDIVGPMQQVAAQLQRTPSKKAKLIKFFTEKFPIELSRRN